MAFHKPEQIAGLVIEAGVQKVKSDLCQQCLFSVFSEDVYPLRLVTNIRVLGNLPERWGV